jgi:hypothetical protein
VVFEVQESALGFCGLKSGLLGGGCSAHEYISAEAKKMGKIRSTLLLDSRFSTISG